MDLSFQSNNVKDVSLPKLASEVYIVQLKTNTMKEQIKETKNKTQETSRKDLLKKD